MTWIEKCGGRKVVFGFICLVALFGSLFVGVAPEVYSTFAYALIGLYAALATGNAGEHLASALRGSKTNE